MPEPSPADWYPDPFGRHERRYWDGSKWTDHVASRGRQEVDPPVDAPPVAVSPQIPADWYPDPYGRHERRYWDGSRWTDHVTSRGLQEIDPPCRRGGSSARQPTKQEGRATGAQSRRR